MKRLFVLCICFFFVTVAAQDLVFDKNLTGWVKKGKNIAADPAVRTSRHCSLRLNGYSSATRKLKLEKGCEYEISFNIRGKDIASDLNQFGVKTAAYAILRANKRARLLGRLENGTFDWKRTKARVSTLSFGGGTEITLALVLRGKGTVWFDDIKVMKVSAGAGDPEAHTQYFRHFYTSDIREASVIPEGIAGFFDPGEKVRFTFLLDPHPADLAFKCKVKDDTGKVVFEQPLKALQKELLLPGQVPGYYVAEFELYRQGKKVCRIQSAFVVNRAIAGRDPFFAGGFGAYFEMMKGLKRIGIGQINLKITSFLPGKKYSAGEMVALNMRRGHRAFIESGDFQLSAVFTGTVVQKDNPSAAKVKAGCPVSTDAYWDHYAAVAEQYIIQNRGKIRNDVIQSEIPSQAGHKERNCGTFTESMFNLMISSRIVSRLVRRLDPEAQVWFGGNNRMEFQNTTERIVAEDLAKDIDGLIIDAYTGNWYLAPGVGYRIPEEKLQEFIRMASSMSVRLGLANGKAVRNEELGYAIRYGEPFDGKYAILQAALSARNLILSKASSACMMEIHTPMRYLQKAPRNEDRYMGTVWRPGFFKGKGRTRVVPLPGGAMYAAAASELAFASFREKIIGGSLYAVVFTKPGGKTVTAIWDTEGKRKMRIFLPCAARLVNMYGRETALPAGDAVLSVSPEPCYLTLSASPEKVIGLIRSAVLANTPECISKAYMDSASSVKVFVRNQTGKILHGKLVFPGVKEKVIRVLPGKVASYVLPVKTGGRLISASGREYPVELVQSAVHPVEFVKGKVVFDGTGRWLKGLRSGLLKYPENIRPSDALQEERCYFKTPGNPNGHSVSARYWTACDKENFYLAVEVDDPVHLQRYSENQIWRDDCVQFAFADSSYIPEDFRDITDRQKKSHFNYCVALSGSKVYYCKMGAPGAGVKNYPARVTRKNGKTFYEICIPFKVFGSARPKRFGFVVFDNNYPALKIAPYWLEFSPGVTSHKDSSYLKLLDWK